MDAWDDERSQSIQIGAIILFGALVVLFSVYQATVVPQQNADVESNHLQTVDRQMQELRNTVVSLPGSGSDKSVTLTLGTTYPARIIAVNPGPPTGALRTVETQNGTVNLTLANAVATDSEVDDFWDGTDRAYNTGGVAYVPNYNEYKNAPTFVYENTLLTKDFRSGNLSVTGQRLVDGTQLTLITLNGSYDRASVDSVAFDVEAVSASDTTVSITNETGANVTIRVASRRNASDWREVLQDDEQFTDQGGHVVGVTETPLPHQEFDRIDIELEGDVTYTLRMAKAGVGTQVTDEAEAYLTDIQGDGASIQENSTTDLVVEVRDEFNNPVSGVDVDAKIEDATENGTISPADATTDADGEAVFDHESVGINGVSSRSFGVNFSIAGRPDSKFDPTTTENVTMSVTVQNTDGSGTGGTGGAYSVDWLTNNGDDLTVDLAGGSSVSKDLAAGASLAVEGLNFDYAVNDTSVATLSPDEGVTNSSGENSTTLTADQTGTVGVYVVSGGSSDEINVTVTDSGGGGGNQAPSVSISSTSVSPVGGSGKHDVDVTFSASDPDGSSDISSYTVELYDDSTKSTVIDSVSSGSYDGSSTTVTLSDSDTGQYDDPFYVRVEVTDSASNVGSDETST